MGERSPASGTALEFLIIPRVMHENSCGCHGLKIEWIGQTHRAHTVATALFAPVEHQICRLDQILCFSGESCSGPCDSDAGGEPDCDAIVSHGARADVSSDLFS